MIRPITLVNMMKIKEPQTAHPAAGPERDEKTRALF
jgi:hypothetical protein